MNYNCMHPSMPTSVSSSSSSEASVVRAAYQRLWRKTDRPQLQSKLAMHVCVSFQLSMAVTYVHTLNSCSRLHCSNLAATGSYKQVILLEMVSWDQQCVGWGSELAPAMVSQRSQDATERFHSAAG
jgi:hypothetical protein